MDDTEKTTAAPDFGIAPPGHRLPADLRLGRVRLRVANLDRSLAFYRRVLGLEALERSAGVAELGAAGGQPLLALDERPGARPAPPGGRIGLYHFAVLLPDRAALGRLVAHLAAIGVPAGAADHLVSNSLYLRDPDGLGIEVYADRPREEWTVEDRQLVMATLPLDLDDLVRRAAGEPWSGVPRGTRIGHLHLHVADLARARAFYHGALGLDLTVWSYPGALFLAAPGYHHHLGLNVWATDERPPETDQAQLLDWEIRLPDGAALEAARAAVEEAGHAAEGAGDGFVARDPWGTAVRLTAARGATTAG